MDQFSFHGPFAYRWIDDVPVERIDLRSGERRPIEVSSADIAATMGPGPPGSPMAPSPDAPWQELSDAVVRASMAAWN